MSMNNVMQKYALLNPKRRPVLEGLLAVKKGGLYEASKSPKMAAQEFKSEHISNGEKIDCSYLLNRELDFDYDESDINTGKKWDFMYHCW